MLNTEQIINEINDINDEHVHITVTGLFVEDEQDYIEFEFPKNRDKKTTIYYSYERGWYINNSDIPEDSEIIPVIKNKLLKIFKCEKANTKWLFGVINNYMNAYNIKELEIYSEYTYFGELADRLFELDNDRNGNPYGVSKHILELIKIVTEKITKKYTYT